MYEDDGRCHICRQWPLEQSPHYTISTCVSCKETDEANRRDYGMAMKMLSVVAVFVVACCVLAGCGQFSRDMAKWNGYSRMCVDGVSYLQFTSGASVEYTRDGKVKGC